MAALRAPAGRALPESPAGSSRPASAPASAGTREADENSVHRPGTGRTRLLRGGRAPGRPVARRARVLPSSGYPENRRNRELSAPRKVDVRLSRAFPRATAETCGDLRASRARRNGSPGLAVLRSVGRVPARRWGTVPAKFSCVLVHMLDADIVRPETAESAGAASAMRSAILRRRRTYPRPGPDAAPRRATGQRAPGGVADSLVVPPAYSAYARAVDACANTKALRVITCMALRFWPQCPR